MDGFVNADYGGCFFPPLLRQRSHHALECDQGNSVCGKGPQEAWQKAPPVRSGPAFSAHSHRGFPPVAELSAVKVVRHDALLDDVGGVTRDPEYLCADAAGPEIDGGSRERGVSLEKAGEDVVRAPHEEKEGAKQKSGAEAVIEAADSMIFELVLEGVSWCKEKKIVWRFEGPPYEFVCAVYWAPVFHPFGAAAGIVLYLQPGFDVLNRRGDETDCPACEHASNSMAYGRESLAIWVHVLFE